MNPNRATAKYLRILACALVFGSMFVCLTRPVSDPDFWWHLASGRAMAEKGGLLDADPFTLEGDFPGDEGKVSFILTYSWLSQVAVFQVHDRFGMTGVVLLFASIYTATFAALYRLVRRTGTDFATSMFLVLLSFAVVVFEFHYNVERPQAWSTLFAVLVVSLAEAARKGRKWAEYSLPPLMALWANLHGGFVLGDLILLLYSIGAAVSRTGSRRFHVVAAVSILASGINPNGFKAALSFPILGPLAESFRLVSREESKAVFDSIVENQSLFGHAPVGGIVRRLPFLCTFLLLSLASTLPALRAVRRVRVDHLLLFVVLLVMGTRSIRYIVFFVTIGSFIAAASLREWVDAAVSPAVRKAATYLRPAAAALLLVAFLPAGAAQARASSLVSGVRYQNPYEDVLAFMRQGGFRGNLFNDYNAGGAAIWALSPGMKVFVDGRAIHPKAMRINQGVMSTPLTRPPGWDLPVYKLALEKYRIDFVLTPGCDPTTGNLVQLAPVLIEDPGWCLIHADSRALLFVRNDPAHKDIVHCFRKPSSLAFDHILAGAQGASANRHARRMTGWKLSMAVGWAGVGETVNAARWLEEYLADSPNDPFALAMRDRLTAVSRREVPYPLYQ